MSTAPEVLAGNIFSKGDLTGWATVILALATAVGALGVFMTLRSSVAESRRENEFQRRRATVEFYSSTMQRQLEWQRDLPPDREAVAVSALVNDAQRLYLSPEDSDDPLKVKALEAANAASEPKRTLIHSYLGFWELAATALETGLFDVTFLKRLWRGRIINIATNYREFIDAERYHYSSSALYTELQTLARTWENESAPSVTAGRTPGGSSTSRGAARESSESGQVKPEEVRLSGAFGSAD